MRKGSNLGVFSQSNNTYRVSRAIQVQHLLGHRGRRKGGRKEVNTILTEAASLQITHLGQKPIINFNAVCRTDLVDSSTVFVDKIGY
jgi:hypothetical protein